MYFPKLGITHDMAVLPLAIKRVDDDEAGENEAGENKSSGENVSIKDDEDY
jgi:hypothetical protein